MKNIVLFIFIVILLSSCTLSGSTPQLTKEENKNLIIFDQPEETIEISSYKVFQVLEKRLCSCLWIIKREI